MTATAHSPTVSLDADSARATEAPPAAPARRSPSASLFRGATALLSTQPLTWAARLLTLIVVPRYLGDAVMGQFASVTTISVWVGLVGSLGIPELLRRRSATVGRDETATDAATALCIALGCTAAIAGAIGAVSLVAHLSILDNPLLPIALVGATVLAPGSVLSAVLQGQERYAWFVRLNVGVTLVCSIIGAVVLIATSNVAAFMVVNYGVTAIFQITSWYLYGLPWPFHRFRSQLLTQLVRGGFPFLCQNAVISLRSGADIILIGLLLGAHEAGWLAVSYRITTIAVFIPTVIITPLLPILTRTQDDLALFKQTLARGLTAVLVMSIPVCAMLIAVTPSIPGLLGWQRQYDNVVTVVAILALQQPLGAVSMVLMTALMALHRERLCPAILFAGAIFNIGMNIALIPAFEQLMQNGAIGAAVTEVASEVLVVAGAVVLFPRGFLGLGPVWLAARLALAGAALVFCTRILLADSVVLAVAAGVVAFTMVALATRVLRWTDLLHARRRLLEMTGRAAS